MGNHTVKQQQRRVPKLPVLYRYVVSWYNYRVFRKKHTEVWNAPHCWMITGRGNVWSLQPNEQHALRKMAYSVE